MTRAFKILPKNLMPDWGYFEDWAAGDAVAPTGWVMAGTAGSVEKAEYVAKVGQYAMKITSGAADSYKAELSLPNHDDYAGKTITFGMWVLAYDASKARIYIDDGTTVTYSSYQSGSWAYEFLQVTVQVGVGNSELTFGCEVQSNAIETLFDAGIAVEGEDLFTELSDDNVAISDFQPSMSLKLDEYQIARREGVFIPEYHLNRNSLRIGGTVIGSDVASCRTHFDGLLQSLMSWKQKEMRHLYVYDDRVLDVFLKNFNWNYVNSMLMIKFNMQLAVPDAASRYIGKIRNSEVIGATITDFNIPYNGNVFYKPQISFVADQGGAISTCSLKNLTTGETLAYTGTVPNGATLNIDCFEATVKNSGINKIQDFTGVFLSVVRGTNYFRFTGSDCTIKIDWFNRWF